MVHPSGVTTYMKKHRLLSLFSGCGGMDLGFEGNFPVLKSSINPKTHKKWIASENGKYLTLKETSFSTVFANDILKEARNSWIPFFKKRGTDPSVFHFESIVDLVKKHEKGEFSFPQKIDIVTGGFPCQDFSLAGKRLGFESHKDHNGVVHANSNSATVESRGRLYMWMREVISIVRPKVFIAENVKGLATLGDVKKIIEDDFRNIGEGYIVVPARILNAKDFGIPQNRERIIFIGLRKDAMKKKPLAIFSSGNIPPELDVYPMPTHGPGPHLLPYVNLGQVFEGLPEPELSSNDPSHLAYSRAKYYGKGRQGNTEISLERVSPTIRAEHHGNIEFRRLSRANGGGNIQELSMGFEERRLSVRECSRIQTFPDDFHFVSPKTKDNPYPLSGSGAYKVIGNAVPPLMAFHVASRLEDIWYKLFRR